MVRYRCLKLLAAICATAVACLIGEGMSCVRLRIGRLSLLLSFALVWCQAVCGAAAVSISRLRMGWPPSQADVRQRAQASLGHPDPVGEARTMRDRVGFVCVACGGARSV